MFFLSCGTKEEDRLHRVWTYPGGDVERREQRRRAAHVVVADPLHLPEAMGSTSWWR